uniref:Uncharacterized protein n=2 Tax=Avena sativa TaxID=4498 RepID=A0ACD5XQ94_AVESA
MWRGGDNDDSRHHRRIPRLVDIEAYISELYYSDDDDEVDLEQPRSELEALHIARCDSIIQYDPKKDARVFTRVCNINLAGFDLDRESKVGLGPPLKYDTPETLRFGAQKSANVISVKVIESDRGYPVSLYGTVVARDIIDFRCIYLFRREREDPQIINSAEDMLTLTGPRRGLIISDFIYFEFDLKVKGDPDDDFSKGVIEDRGFDNEPITIDLPSWLSTMELVFQPVELPVAASLQVNILNGPPNAPFIGKISACTRNTETHIILYDGRATKGSGRLLGDDGSILLSRNMVVVPTPRWYEEEEILVHVCFFDDDEDEGTQVSVLHPDQEHVCTHGSHELQVKVEWNFILSRPRAKHIETRAFLLPPFYTCPNYDG